MAVNRHLLSVPHSYGGPCIPPGPPSDRWVYSLPGAPGQLCWLFTCTECIQSDSISSFYVITWVNTADYELKETEEYPLFTWRQFRNNMPHQRVVSCAGRSPGRDQQIRQMNQQLEALKLLLKHLSHDCPSSWTLSFILYLTSFGSHLILSRKACFTNVKAPFMQSS